MAEYEEKREQEKRDHMSKQGKRDFRPNIHFTPEKNWNNDPNGLIYIDGIWHLYYQNNPNDVVWGPMHWGHARPDSLGASAGRPVPG